MVNGISYNCKHPILVSGYVLLSGYVLALGTYNCKYPILVLHLPLLTIYRGECTYSCN